MIDIDSILQDYCEQNDVYHLVDTEFGQNEWIDRFRYAEQQYALWLNIIESGTFDMAGSVNSRVVNHQRTVSITMAEKCIKEDEGANYYNQFVGLLSQQENLFKYLVRMFNVSSASYETAVDWDDLNMVATTLTITFEDTDIVC